jgi:coenzyme F420-reducing hydrogenase gamma subunit
MVKPRVAIFDFACCEGCQLQIVNMEEEILDLLSVIRPVEWREAMSDKAESSESFDVAFVEGSITREEDAERLREIRYRAKFLVALGACATMGGVNKLKNNFGINDVKETVYGEDAEAAQLETAPVRSVAEVVPVDHMIHGCPIEAAELVTVVKSLLAGKTPPVPDHPVCVECKMKENVCRYEYDEICLGPLTRAGCGARCPSEGFWCFGCRGYVDEPNREAAREVMARYGKTLDDLRGKTLLFNSK